MPLDAPVTIATLLNSLFNIVLDPTPRTPERPSLGIAPRAYENLDSSSLIQVKLFRQLALVAGRPRGGHRAARAADVGPQMPGATVTFTATAAGGTAPYQFKWWLWDGATWTVLEDWSTGNTFAWTPSTPNPNFAVGVWARRAGNTADQPDGYPANTGAYGRMPFAIN
jgi:hypothetical protein